MATSRTLDELIVSLIIKDKTLSQKLTEKVTEAIYSFDMKEMVADNIGETITAVFENDEVYTMLEDSIKKAISNAVTDYFRH